MVIQPYSCFSECPCYDQVIPVLLSEGIGGVADKCKLTPGIPLKPMLAHPTKGVQEVLTRFENAKFTCEWKYDGERAQIHLLSDGSIRIYSRNQEDNTSKYPDIIQRFASCKLEGVKTCVLDSEAVAWDREKKQIQPFQVGVSDGEKCLLPECLNRTMMATISILSLISFLSVPPL